MGAQKLQRARHQRSSTRSTAAQILDYSHNFAGAVVLHVQAMFGRGGVEAPEADVKMTKLTLRQRRFVLGSGPDFAQPKSSKQIARKAWDVVMVSAFVSFRFVVGEV